MTKFLVLQILCFKLEEILATNFLAHTKISRSRTLAQFGQKNDRKTIFGKHEKFGQKSKLWSINNFVNLVYIIYIDKIVNWPKKFDFWPSFYFKNPAETKKKTRQTGELLFSSGYWNQNMVTICIIQRDNRKHLKSLNLKYKCYQLANCELWVAVSGRKKKNRKK